MRILIDATPISPQPSGIGLLVVNLISELQKLQVDHQFEIQSLCPTSLKGWIRRKTDLPTWLEHVPNPAYMPHPEKLIKLLITKNNILSPFLKFDRYFDNPDVIHGTNYAVYPFQKGRHIMSIYDLSFIRYPHYTTHIIRTFADRVKTCLQWTDAVITISESSKRDIVHYLGVDPEVIYVTPCSSRYTPDYLDRLDVDALAQSCSYDVSKPYLLFVSTIEPRKNVTALIQAFNYLKEKHKIPHDLLLVGAKGWLYEPIFEEIGQSPWRQSIYHLDYISDELLALLYRQAEALVYPSHYEGFGLPVLEAMTLGAPVITSWTSSLPEVAGDAALLIDPDEPLDLAEAIMKVISDSDLREQLVQRGRERAERFSWQKMALETLKAYRGE